MNIVCGIHTYTHTYICLLYFAQKSTTNREWTDVNKREYPKKNQNLYPAEVCIIFTTFYLRISLNPISRKKHLTEKSICQVKMPTFFLSPSRPPFSSHVPTHTPVLSITLFLLILLLLLFLFHLYIVWIYIYQFRILKVLCGYDILSLSSLLPYLT